MYPFILFAILVLWLILYLNVMNHVMKTFLSNIKKTTIIFFNSIGNLFIYFEYFSLMTIYLHYLNNIKQILK